MLEEALTVVDNYDDDDDASVGRWDGQLLEKKKKEKKTAIGNGFQLQAPVQQQPDSQFDGRKKVGSSFPPKIEARRERREINAPRREETRDRRGPSVAAKVAACGGAWTDPEST